TPRPVATTTPAAVYPGWNGKSTLAFGRPRNWARSVPGLTTLVSIATVTSPYPGFGTSTATSSARPASGHTTARPRSTPLRRLPACTRAWSHQNASRFASFTITSEWPICPRRTVACRFKNRRMRRTSGFIPGSAAEPGGEVGPGAVALADHARLGGWPLDREERVVPANARGRLRGVRRRDHVHDVDIVDERLKAVSESLGNVHRAAAGLVELGAEPAPERGRAPTEVDDHVEDCAARTADELRLLVR